MTHAAPEQRPSTEEALHALAATTGCVAWVTDIHQRVFSRSAGWEDFTGQRWPASCERGWVEAIHPGDRGALRAALKRAYEVPGAAVLQCRVWSREAANYRQCTLRLAPTRSGRGPPTGYVFALTPNTSDAIRVGSEKLGSGIHLGALARAVVENSEAAIFVKDTKGRYLLANPKCEMLWGLSREEILGKDDHELCTAEVAERVCANDQAVLSSGQPAEFEERVDFQGGERDFLSLKVPLMGADGRALGLCGIATEITERKAKEAELRNHAQQLAELERERREMLSLLAHELRNPLAPIRSALDLLRLQSDSELNVPLSIIDRQTRHLTQIVDDLLDSARIAHGKVELHPEPVEISKVVMQALENARELTAGRKHEVVVNYSSNSIWVRGDECRLVQFLDNLITNAAKYTETNGRIQVDVRVERDKAVVRIKDSGIGMAPDLLAHAFDPFSQGKRPLDRSDGGLGLGLTVARNLVELHGGSVTAFSDGVGHGSEVVVQLPRESEEQERSQGPPSTAV